MGPAEKQGMRAVVWGGGVHCIEWHQQQFRSVWTGGLSIPQTTCIHIPTNILINGRIPVV
jgi:hypothetical protein